MHDPGPVPPMAARVFAWTGAALFALSLTYFLYTYIVTFGEIPANAITPSWAAIAWDTALFGLFAAHHSIFARARVRAWMASRVPPRLERAVYVWIASLLLAAVCTLWLPLPGVAWRMTGGWRWAMSLPLVVGLWLTLRSAGVIDIWELAGVRQLATPDARPSTPQPSQRPGPERETEGAEFKTAGPYGMVRHPIYLGWILIVLSVPTMTMTRLVFAAVSCLYLVLAIPLEERTIIALAGDGYRDYMRRVRWRLIPGVY